MRRPVYSSTGNRFYHPPLGRWVSRDPIGYEGGVNLYEYVGGMPCNSLDPYGLARFCCTYLTRSGKTGPWTDVVREDVNCPAWMTASDCCKVRCADSKDQKRNSGSSRGTCSGGSATPPPGGGPPCQPTGPNAAEREPVPPKGGWEIEPKGTNWIGFCFAGCLPCNKNRVQPTTACQTCVTSCFKQGTKLCDKKNRSAQIGCRIALRQTMVAVQAICTAGL